MKVYYNEIDDFCCAWLSNLMDDGLISPGKIDNRSIWDVLPDEVSKYDRAHFFAGIGVWELALNLAGWNRPVWTGSAPCQPFSAAGKGEGFADERHLWPAWFHLITHGKRHDIPVLGEQVAAKAGRAWFDLVSSDMEALDHACGALDTSAAGCGAPFIGQRLYWLASAHHQGSQGHRRSGQLDATSGRQVAVGHGASVGAPVGLAASARGEEGSREIRRSSDPAADRYRQAVELGNAGGVCGLAASESSGWSGDALRTGWVGSSGDAADGRFDRMAATTSRQSSDRHIQCGGEHRQQPENPSDSDDSGIPLHPVEYWRDADWLLCRDPNGARFRPVEPSTLTVADGRTVRWRVADGCGEGEEITTHFPLAEKGEYLNRLNEVRGAGNALNISQAATFCEIAKDYLDGVPVT